MITIKTLTDTTQEINLGPNLQSGSVRAETNFKEQVFGSDVRKNYCDETVGWVGWLKLASCKLPDLILS